MPASHPSPVVFLSYSHEDSKVVTRLRTDLQAQGITVWVDREDIQLGTPDWEDAIRTAIRAAHVVLLIASPCARLSRYVKDELRIAELYQRPIYPVWVAGAEWMEAVPIGWGGSQFIDAREACYQEGVRILVKILGSTPLPQSLPEPEKEPRNPYKGLSAFTSSDACDFFGRETLIKDLCETLTRVLAEDQQGGQNARLLALLGPSGSGKSSVMMAGLLPRLRSGALPISNEWVYLEPMVLSEDPIESLAITLKPWFPDTSFKTLREDLKDEAARGLHLLAMQLVKQRETHVVLLVDQFEELFTLMLEEKEEERRHFIDLLVTAATEPHGALIVLPVLRADFYDRPMRYPALHRLIQAHQQSVLPMEVDDLRAVIEQPAALPDVHLTFEGDLVGDLLFEMRNQVGALPLLEFTLDQLFRERRGHLLTLQAYREMGGVKGALTKRAEKAYDDLPSEEHRRLAQALFVRLIVPGATEQDTARRRAALSEFSLHDVLQKPQMQKVIDDFIRARLLTTNEVGGTTTIEVSHEVLLRQWPSLASWVRKAREDIPLQQRISSDVAEWERRGRPRDRLYRDSQLRDAQAWATRNLLSEKETAFLQASAVQRVRSLISVIVVVLLLLSTTGVAGWFLLQDPTHVTSLSDDGAGSLRRAIENAPSGSTITFDPSLWRHTIVLTSNLLITKKRLRIQGPGAGLLIVSNNSHSISVDSGVSLSIFGLTFKGSKDNTTFLLINSGTLILTNSSVSGNSGGHGGIDNFSTLILTNSSVSGNSGGHGIDNEHGGTLTLINSSVSGNSGGIQNSGMLMLTNSTISDNTASYGGYGIENFQGIVTLTNSTISGNSASYGGGGIDNYRGTVMLTNSTISGNSASSYSNDTASGIGGGIGNREGTLTLTNSTISGNSASNDGGGIDNIGGTVTITFCTISGNTARNGGGILTGVDFNPDHLASVEMRNSLVALNHAGIGPDIAGGLTSDGYNLIQNNSGATFTPNKHHLTDVSVDAHADLRIDPKLRDHSGLAEPYTFTLALLQGSPAIDQVPLDACHISINGTVISTDQRGMKRPDGNETACDIGAYEYTDQSG